MHKEIQIGYLKKQCIGWVFTLNCHIAFITKKAEEDKSHLNKAEIN